MNILFLNTGTKIGKRNKLVVDVILRLDARLSRVCPKIFEEKGHVSCGGGQLRLVRSLALDGGGEVRHCCRLADRSHHVQVVGGGRVEVLHHPGHALRLGGVDGVLADGHDAGDLLFEEPNVERLGSDHPGDLGGLALLPRRAVS